MPRTHSTATAVDAYAHAANLDPRDRFDAPGVTDWDEVQEQAELHMLRTTYEPRRMRLEAE